MKKILEIRGMVRIDNGDGETTGYSISSPTVEMFIEKLGAIERKIEKDSGRDITDSEVAQGLKDMLDNEPADFSGASDDKGRVETSNDR